MKTQQALEVKKADSPSSPVFVEAEKLFQQMKELTQTVAQRAYSFFEERGSAFGHDLEDWFRAEFELMRHIPLEMKENDGQFIIRAEVPGFKAEEIKVSIEPRRVIISGQSEQKKEEETAAKVFSEFRSQHFCRSLDLKAEVDPAQVTATLKDGVLELMLPKAAQKTQTQVEIRSA